MGLELQHMLGLRKDCRLCDIGHGNYDLDTLI